MQTNAVVARLKKMSQPRCPSYYNATIQNETEYPQLDGDVSVDVAIVGGGFSGVNTALELAEKRSQSSDR